jgi:hypothetical protein
LLPAEEYYQPNERRQKKRRQRTSTRELSQIDILRLLVTPPQEEVRHRVEDGVDGGTEDRKGEGGDGGVELENSEYAVASKRPVDGDADCETVVVLLFLGVLDVLIKGLEESFDVCVL